MTERAGNPEIPQLDDALHQAAKMLGRKGGRSTLARHGVEHFAAAGKVGGKVAATRRGPEFFKTIGKLGGDALKARFGNDYFRDIAKRKRSATNSSQTVQGADGNGQDRSSGDVG